VGNEVGQGCDQGVSEVSMQGILFLSTFLSAMMPVGWLFLIGPIPPALGMLSIFIAAILGIASMQYHDVETLQIRGFNPDDPVRIVSRRKSDPDGYFYSYEITFTATISREVYKQVAPGSCTLSPEKEEVTSVFRRVVWVDGWIGKNGELRDSNIWKNQVAQSIKTLDRLDNIRNPFFGNKSISIKHAGYYGGQVRK
jgi:hypothetical protein